MAAGESALRASERFRLLADEHERAAAAARERHRRFLAAGRSEAKVACRIDALASRGWRLLADRRWPGTRRANVDLLAVGPGGVLVIDVKAWHEPRIEDGRLYRGDEDCQDALDALLAITARVEDSVAEVGLPPLEVVPVVVLEDHRLVARVGRVEVLGGLDVTAYCLGRGNRLDAEQVAALVAVLDRDFVPYDDPEAPVSAAVREPVLPLEPQPELFDTAGMVAAELAAALAAPLADWMTWLHPDQARTVRRAWNGPARVSGPAGTGKTVVGLHRTAYLAASRPGRLLFVTYVKTLPEVLRTYYARLSPGTAERVEFTGLHRWAVDLLRSRGVEHGLDPAQADRLFALAWQRAGKDSALRGFHLSQRYWRDEVAWVLKGRGLTDFASYSGLERVGRRMPLRREHRAAVWALHQEYDALLREHAVHDFDDVLSLALAEVRREPLDPPYAAVVVDEVQDLTCVGVRLLHAVAGDRPDALLLIGDGRQAVYPGGFTMAEAGVAVGGRSVLLRANYRNAAEILRAAEEVGAAPAFEDPEVAAGAPVGVRPGGLVRKAAHPTRAAHDAALVAAVRRVVDMDGIAAGEVAVLVPSRYRLRDYVTTLTEAGIACADLRTYDGTEDGHVKVGTFKRAKGLEFKYVFLPLLDVDPPRRRGEDEAAYRERCEVVRREVHVGMTRARDGLWLGYVEAAARTA